MSEPEALQPTLTAGYFAPLGRELVDLLRSLEAADWLRPTVCSQWSVRDVTAHLLDTACRRVGVERDDHALPTPSREIESRGGLVAFLDELNADWVRAARRLSPRLLIDLIDHVERDLDETLGGLDPFGEARFPVAWAGEAGSLAWFDIARELTERWLHQQQIRLAVGAEPLAEPRLSAAIFDTFLRALPSRYAEVSCEPGAAVQIVIEGQEDYAYVLRRRGGGWELLKGDAVDPDATLAVPQEVAWRSLTKGIEPARARERSRVAGREDLVTPFFATIAVMA